MTPQFVVTLGEVSAEGLVRIPLAKLGRWFKGKLKFSITRNDMAQMIANFRKKANDVVIDYDHSTEYAAGQGQPVPAAGWLKAVEDEPDADGVLYGQAEFTERAREMLRAKEYKYISPVLAWGRRDKKTGEEQGATITSVALINQPLLEEMPAIALGERGWSEEPEIPAKEESTMAVKQVVLSDRAASKARVVMEDGTETVLSIEGLSPEPKVIRLSEVQRTKDGRLDLDAIDTRDTLIAGEVFEANRKEAVLDQAVKDGKILPAQRGTYEKLALGDLKTLVASMKPQIDLGERGIGGDGGELSELDRINAQIGSKVKEKIAAEPKLQYHEALKLVASENPDLDRRRTQLIRAGGNK